MELIRDVDLDQEEDTILDRKVMAEISKVKLMHLFLDTDTITGNIID
ncbi:MAG: hypothetical protein KAR42_07060 [candidate division Zixibacteria bacterium]|nr:hypothetical protein [candidate division Zixibacteria bacterium]